MVKQHFNVEEYTFKKFTDSDAEPDSVSSYEFRPLKSGLHDLNRPEFQKIIKQERISAKGAQFKINPIVEKYRGLKNQEEREFEDAIDTEVNIRVLEIHNNAFQAGFDEGIVQGKEEIYNELRSSIEQKVDNFTQMITAVLKTQEEILRNQKQEIYLLVLNLSKWIILRELKDDGKYVERLLEKLLQEIQLKTNLFIQVNSNDFKGMDDVLEIVQSRLGELKNIRVEIDSSLITSGMIVSSENGIINASMEEQFRSLDKLFKDVLQTA